MSMNAVNSGSSDPENKRASGAGGGGPPYDGHMEHRLTALETRFDTILPMLATKADLAELRLDVERMFFNLQVKLTDEMSKLRAEVHATSTSMMRWGVAIAITITVILGVAGQGIYLSKQITDQGIHLGKQIADLSARLPPASVPAAVVPDRPPAAQAIPGSPQAGATTAPR